MTAAQNPRTQSLLPILDILDQAKVSGSLQFTGSCDLSDLPNLPPIRKPVSSRVSPVLQTLRKSFASDPAMRVIQESDGTIRMKEVGVQTDLLDVRINHVSFGEDGIYVPNLALRRLMGAPEVVAFMKTHEIETPFRVEIVQGNLGSWPRDLPHISGSLDNVTLSEAFGHILKTFPGIWVYENCPRGARKGRVVYIRFFGLRRIGASAPFVEE